MSVDISAGDSTPILSKASILQSSIAINKWFKFVELTDDTTTPIQFNKSTITLGSLTAKNTAIDSGSFKIQSTTGTTMGSISGDESASAFKIEAGNIPLFLNTTSVSSRISLRINNSQIAQVTSTGVGIGVTPSEQLSVGTSSNGTGAALGIYALTSGGVTTWATLSQGANNANLTLAYGQGSGGTGKYFVLTGVSGTSYFDPTGNLGINSAGPTYQAYSGGRYVSIKGANGVAAV